MNREQIREIARRQSAWDLGCEPGDFLREEPVVVLSREEPRARKYLQLPFSVNLVSYGGNVVASCSEELRTAVEDYVNQYPAEHCFETPHLHVLNAALAPFGQKLCFMAEYFLPEPAILQAQPCTYPLRLLGPEAFGSLYLPEWSNALCEKRKELDVLGVGAYDRGKLVGFAACSADCEDMWQIGVDVLPAYRRQGIAAAVTSRLAVEILERGKVPFYCAAWCNLPSVRNAVRSGFRPAWVEMTAKPAALVDEMNAR